MITNRVGKAEGLVWMVIGGIICLLSWQTELGSFREPGPGFIAFATGLFMGVVGLLMVLTAVFKKTPSGEDCDSGRTAGLSYPSSWFRMVFTMGLLFGYALLLTPLGYIPTTLLVLWGLFYDGEKRNWVSSLLVASVTTGASFVFFEKLLGLRFPAGILS